MFGQSTKKATNGQQETPVSHMFQYFCSLEKWVGSNKGWYVMSCLTHQDMNTRK